jgi:hypothetical protein
MGVRPWAAQSFQHASRAVSSPAEGIEPTFVTIHNQPRGIPFLDIATFLAVRAASFAPDSFFVASAVFGIEKRKSIFSVHIEIVGFAFDIGK